MSLSFGSLAIIEGPGLRTATQPGEAGLVEDVLQCLVPFPHPSVVAGPFAGVVSRENEARMGGKMISALDGRKVSGSDGSSSKVGCSISQRDQH